MLRINTNAAQSFNLAIIEINVDRFHHLYTFSHGKVNSNE